MADLKWIKLNIDMFNNQKIRYLRSLPEGNNIVLIWVMLLTMAGRCNAGGMIFLTENVPYTTQMLANELDFEEATVKLALQALAQVGMVSLGDEGLLIPGWADHQNIEGMEKIREQSRIRSANYRERKRLESGDAMHHVTPRDRHALEKDKDIDKDKEPDKKEIEIKRECEGEKIDAGKKPAPSRHRYGTYNRVLLSDDDLAKLKAEFSADWQERIDRLDEYIEIHGDKYKNHLATIRAWARKDKQDEHIKQPAGRSAAQSGAPRREYGIVI